MHARRFEKQERKFAIVEQYLQSDQTQKAFRRSVSLPLSKLQFWLKKYRLAKSKLSFPTKQYGQSKFYSI